MTVTQWIETGPPKQIAKKMKVEPSTVSLWRHGRSCPKPKSLIKMHELSGIPYEDLVRHFANGRRRIQGQRANSK